MDAKLRRQLERIPPDALGEFMELRQKHSYSARLDAHHSAHNIIKFGNPCSKTDLIVLSGRDQTGSAGKTKILIDPLLCGVLFENLPGNGSLVMIRNPNFVATPHSSAPVFVTVQTTSTPQTPPSGVSIQDRDGNTIDQDPITNVEANIASWKHDGSPAANTSFSWICTIEAARQFVIGG